MSYLVQTWQHGERVHDDIAGLSLDAAREVARAHQSLGLTARIIDEDDDWCEVWDPRRGIRAGTFAATTLVIHGDRG